MTIPRLASLVGLGFGALVAGWLLVLLLGPLFGQSSGATWSCPRDPAPPSIVWSILYVAVAVGSCRTGYRLGFVRYASRPHGHVSQRQQIVYQAIITAFFLGVATLLLYGAIGTWATGQDKSSQWWPITW